MVSRYSPGSNSCTLRPASVSRHRSSCRRWLPITPGASFALLCFCLLLVGGVSLRGLAESHDDARNFIDGVNARALMVAKIRSAVDDRAIAARNLVLSTDPADVARERDAALAAHQAVATQLAQLQQLALFVDVGFGSYTGDGFYPAYPCCNGTFGGNFKIAYLAGCLNVRTTAKFA